MLNAAGLAGFEPPPLSVPVTGLVLQLVGLCMNPLRSRSTSIARMSSLTPSNTFGITSEIAVICVVSGLTLSATLTTTVPMSYGPATAGVMTTIESGAPL